MSDLTDLAAEAQGWFYDWEGGWRLKYGVPEWMYELTFTVADGDPEPDRLLRARRALVEIEDGETDGSDVTPVRVALEREIKRRETLK